MVNSPKALLAILVMAGGLVVLALGLRGPYERMVARQMCRQLATIPDDRAPGLLGQATELGIAGVPVLAEALGSDRDSVALAARRILIQSLDAWQKQATIEAAQNQAALADALAARVDRFGPAAQRDAAELTSRILTWLPVRRNVDRAQMIASCEKVLRTTLSEPLQPSARVVAALPVESGAADRRPLEVDTSMGPESALANLSSLPGGGLRPELAVEDDVRQAVNVARKRPGSFFRLPPIEAPKPLRRPDRLSAKSEVETAKRPTRDTGSAAARTPTTAQLAPADRGDALPALPSGDLSDLETEHVMRWLRSKDRRRVARAEAELSRRGFRSVHFELARQLFHPDPQVRKDLIRALPSLMSIDAVPWMLWLSRDPDAEVRLAAITLMATTGDPALLDQVTRLARTDPDPRIQRQGERLARRPR